MIYTARIEHYREWDNQLTMSGIFVCADTIVEVAQKISNYYGDECLESVEIRPFSPDDMLIFDYEQDNGKLFWDVKSTLEKNIIW